MAGGNKVFFTVGGRGTKPDQDYRHASIRRFTKKGRNLGSIPGNMTRQNDSSKDNRLRYMTKEEIVKRDNAIEASGKLTSPYLI